jgi:hypothetical protein
MASTDNNGGLFFEKNSIFGTAVLNQFPVGRAASRKYYVVDYHLWDSCITRPALSNRACAVQERLLAPRLLHFGGEQLFWECSKLEACESCPEGISKHLKAPFGMDGEGELTSNVWKLFFTPLPKSYGDFEILTEGKRACLSRMENDHSKMLPGKADKGD